MDARALTAGFYDLAPDFPPDIPFYLQQVSGDASSVLELGCGTGRVTVPLAGRARFVHGVDLSPTMIARCQARLNKAGIPPARALASVGDITQLRLQATFSLIIAPYHVFQNLGTEAEVAGLFATVRAHLAPGGRCILNTFRPRADPATLIAKWQTPGEDLDWEIATGGEVLRCYVRRAGVLAEPLVLYPDLIYRRYRGARLEEEAVASIAMRCWYPEELHARVRREGFDVTGSWGGYQGEAFGTGPELIVALERT